MDLFILLDGLPQNVTFKSTSKMSDDLLPSHNAKETERIYKYMECVFGQIVCQPVDAPPGKRNVCFGMPSIIRYQRKNVEVQENNQAPSVYKNKKFINYQFFYVHIHNMNPAKDAYLGISMNAKLLYYLE